MAAVFSHSMFGSGHLFGAPDFIGTTGNDVQDGTSGNDSFDYSQGGNDTLRGLGGDDDFYLGTELQFGDRIDGGAGSDLLSVSGFFAQTVVCDPDTIQNIETIKMLGGTGIDLNLDPANVGAGKRLVVDNRANDTDHAVRFSLGGFTAEGLLKYRGGPGADTASGGAGNDEFTSGAGTGDFAGLGGADRFNLKNHDVDFLRYTQVSDSTSIGFDVAFDFGKHDIFVIPTDITKVDDPIFGGTLNQGTFDADLANAVNASTLHKHHAVLFEADNGTHAGYILLVVDANGHAGYQASEDYVIAVFGLPNPGALHADNFENPI